MIGIENLVMGILTLVIGAQTIGDRHTDSSDGYNDLVIELQTLVIRTLVMGI